MNAKLRSVGLRGARRALGATLVLSTILSGSITAPALAHDASGVDCGIYVLVSRFETKPGFGGDEPDMKARLSINGVNRRYGEIGDRHAANTSWAHEVGLPCHELTAASNERLGIPVEIDLADDDSWPNDDDNPDISPAPKDRDLHLWVRVPNLDQGNIGTLTNRDTGETVGTFPTTDWAYDQPIRWQTGILTSEGQGTDRDTRIFYEVHVLREPDLVVQAISQGVTTSVTVANTGGPGILTAVECWRRGGAVRHKVGLDMPAGASLPITVNGRNWEACSAIGINVFGGPEPHTDNNARNRR